VTPAVVLDASVAITFLLRQDGVEEVDRRFEQWLASGVEMSVPMHFWLETSNALMRRHRVTGGALVGSIHRLDELGLATIAVDRPLLLLAVDRAERFSLTTYDATYLALAELLDATLFTSDHEMLAAAGVRGLSPGATQEHRLSEQPVTYGLERQPTWPDYSGASAYLAKLRAEAIRPT
jgi:predicted nucleic acid-binding protein